MKTAKLIASALSSFSLALLWVSYGQASNAQVYGQVTPLVGGCLDANLGQFGKQAYMRPCDNGQNDNLQWALEPVYNNGFEGDFFIRSKKSPNRCLDSNSVTAGTGRPAYLRTCNRSNLNLLWTTNSLSQLVTRTSTRYCLDANLGQLGSPAYMRPCDNGQNNNLRWLHRLFF